MTTILYFFWTGFSGAIAAAPDVAIVRVDSTSPLIRSEFASPLIHTDRTSPIVRADR